jgi:predicted DNA-binding mobile mystery protein A
MDERRQELRRRQLDRQLAPISALLPVPTPSGGWIKSVREALGWSLEDFAQKLGLASRSTVFQLEGAEVNESITVKRLRSAADALGCDLAIVFLPRVPLSETAETREREAASVRYGRLRHSMALEGQAVAEERVLEIAQLEIGKRTKRRAPKAQG